MTKLPELECQLLRAARQPRVDADDAPALADEVPLAIAGAATQFVNRRGDKRTDDAAS
jgi:hypothetical protein